MLRGVSDDRIGPAFRAVRLRRGLRQKDVALAAGVSHALISLIERGHVSSLTLETLRRVGSVLEIRLDVKPRWRGGELDRLLNSGHSALAEAVTVYLQNLGWTVAPEVSFSHYGERGYIDLVAWHATTGTLLVIELKTLIVDVQELIGVTDMKTRNAARAVAGRGWTAATVATLVIVTDSATNRRRAAAHRAVLKSAYPSDGRNARRWLRQPKGPFAGLLFYANANPRSPSARTAGRQRVRVAARKAA
jgi:transcriptional regulator with XRE-family HTH domain